MKETYVTELKITETTIKGRKCRFVMLQIGETAITLGYLDNFNKLHLYIN